MVASKCVQVGSTFVGDVWNFTTECLGIVLRQLSVFCLGCQTGWNRVFEHPVDDVFLRRVFAYPFKAAVAKTSIGGR